MPRKKNTNKFPNAKERRLSSLWIEKSKAFAKAINEYVKRGERLRWKNVGDQPKETRLTIAKDVLNAVRRANEVGTTEQLGKLFPTAYEPFFEMVKENGQSLSSALLLDDGRVILRVGTEYLPDSRFQIVEDLSVKPLPKSIVAIGRSSNRRYFAVAKRKGVEVHEGWDGSVVNTFHWPTGNEGIPSSIKIKARVAAPIVNQIIPYSDGKRVLLISREGIFILTKKKAIRLLPSRSEIDEHREWIQKENPNQRFSHELDMVHGTISNDDSWIIAGHQMSSHLVYDAKTLKCVAEIGSRSEYPHHAVFSNDGSMMALNSCHFYSGQTIGVPTKLLPGIKTEPYEGSKRWTTLENGSRVYASCTRKGEFIIGDARGYLIAFDLKGKILWRHFIGSTIDAIDISRDGKTLIVTTFAGFLCFLKLDEKRPDPFVIGESNHHEIRRWLFWKKEKTPLVW